MLNITFAVDAAGSRRQPWEAGGKNFMSRHRHQRHTAASSRGPRSGARPFTGRGDFFYTTYLGSTMYQHSCSDYAYAVSPRVLRIYCHVKLQPCSVFVYSNAILRKVQSSTLETVLKTMHTLKRFDISNKHIESRPIGRGAAPDVRQKTRSDRNE